MQLHAHTHTVTFAFPPPPLQLHTRTHMELCGLTQIHALADTGALIPELGP